MEQNTNWKDLAHQLSNPQGEAGIETGKQMERTNANMIARTIDILNIKENEKVLEIGFGNGSHVGYLLNKAAGVQYTGIDISETMLQQALATNSEAISKQQAYFILSDGNTIPFGDNTFNKILTVNTIYFWKNPRQYAVEIGRVLKPGGRCCITFGEKTFMEGLPFVQHGFTLYDVPAVEQLLRSAGLTAENHHQEDEQVKSNAGETVTRTFIVTSAVKVG